MKKKRLLLFGTAAGICMISAIFLIGSMGIYAEKSGTGEWIPDTETEGAPSLMEWNETEAATVTAEEGDAADAGLLPDEELRDIWEKMYAEYLAQLEKEEGDPGYDPGIARVESDPEYTEESLLLAGDTEYLDAVEAGIFVLKEIGRLYPKDRLESFKITHFQMNDYLYKRKDGISESKYQWDGYLSNGNEYADQNHISYQFTINALSGKIRDISRFHPYRLDADYWDRTWTEEEVKERGRQLIEKYRLAEGEELDWENVKVSVRDAEQVAEIREEMEADPEFAGDLWNVLIFYKEGERQFYLGIDWATGELGGYDWYD